MERCGSLPCCVYYCYITILYSMDIHTYILCVYFIIPTLVYQINKEKNESSREREMKIGKRKWMHAFSPFLRYFPTIIQIYILIEYMDEYVSYFFSCPISSPTFHSSIHPSLCVVPPFLSFYILLQWYIFSFYQKETFFLTTCPAL